MRNAPPTSPSRRHFLKGSAAGITFAFILPELAGAAATGVPPAALRPNIWVRIEPDDTVVIMAPASELGQGSMTSLPLILAEELDADWDKVRIEFTPSDAKLYGNPFMLGLMLTIASLSVPGYYTPLRLAGAKARRSLMLAVADMWNVPADELATEPNVVVHRASGRRIAYGAVAAAVTALPDPPDLKEADLKPPAQFRLIGKDVLRRDLAAKIDGTAGYAGNIRLPNMLYATVTRAPVLGSVPTGIDDAAARKVPGVTAVKQLADAVAIIGTTMEAVLKARGSLSVSWSSVPAAEKFGDEEGGAAYLAIARDTGVAGRAWDQKGDLAAAFTSDARIIAREYRTDYMYHAQIEPLNAVASVTEDGKRVELWAGTQAPAYAVQSVAAALGIDGAAVTLHRSYSGGAFGRRAAIDQDYVVDAALLSKEYGRPVKIVWSRQDDVQAGRFKPMTGQWFRVAVDKDGNITGWHHRVACEDPSAMQDAPRWVIRKESPIVAMAGADLGPYEVPNRLVEFIRQPVIVRIAPMRGTGGVPTRFAVEQFVDEVALELGRDPIEMRRRLLRSSPRALAVLDRVAQMSDWGRNEPGRAKGVSFSDYDNTMLAAVIEVSVNRDSGVIRAHRVWVAIDPGVVIQPNNTIALIEGGMIFGISNALKEQIGIVKGRVQQSAFDDYPLLRHDEAPDSIEVELVASNARPAGIGEISAVPGPAALANAFATLTGRRMRHLPLIPERVKAALAEDPVQL